VDFIANKEASLYIAICAIKTERHYISFLKKATKWMIMQIKLAKYQEKRLSPNIKNLFEKIKNKFEKKWTHFSWELKLDEEFFERVDELTLKSMQKEESAAKTKTANTADTFQAHRSPTCQKMKTINVMRE